MSHQSVPAAALWGLWDIPRFHRNVVDNLWLLRLNLNKQNLALLEVAVSSGLLVLFAMKLLQFTGMDYTVLSFVVVRENGAFFNAYNTYIKWSITFGTGLPLFVPMESRFCNTPWRREHHRSMFVGSYAITCTKRWNGHMRTRLETTLICLSAAYYAIPHNTPHLQPQGPNKHPYAVR